MKAGLRTMVRAGGAALCAMMMTGAAMAQDRFEVILYQAGGAPTLADLKPSTLPLIMITRPELGKEAVFIETDQAGADRAKGAASGPALVYKALSAHVQASDVAKGSAASLKPGATGEAQTYYLFAHVEAAAGKEAAFNDFYNATHLPEVLMVPGMQWAVRGELVSQAPTDLNAPRTFALYEVKSHDIAATMAEFDRRMKGGIIKPFPDGIVGPNMLISWAGPKAAAHAHQH